jgi:hypothetical protein
MMNKIKSWDVHPEEDITAYELFGLISFCFNHSDMKSREEWLEKYPTISRHMTLSCYKENDLKVSEESLSLVQKLKNLFLP